MKSVGDAFVNLWRRLDWFDRTVGFILAGGVFFAALAGNAEEACWYAIVLTLWCALGYWRNTADDQRAEIQHLRTALRDTVRPSEFTIEKPTAYQITVGGKAPEWQPNRDVVAAVEAAEANWRDAATRRVELLKNIEVSTEAADSARREVEAAQFLLEHARENAASELARMAALVDGGTNEGMQPSEVVITNGVHSTDWKSALDRAIDSSSLRRGGR